MGFWLFIRVRLGVVSVRFRRSEGLCCWAGLGLTLSGFGCAAAKLAAALGLLSGVGLV